MSKKLITSIIVLFLLQSSLLTVKGNQLKENPVDEIIKSTEEIYEYYSYQNMTNLLFELQENHSEIMSVTSYGKTYQGRDIWVVKLSDNVTIDEDEPGVLLFGALHGNEKPAFEILIYFIKYMVGNYSKENTDNDDDGQINEDPIDGFDNDEDGLIDEDPSEDRVREVINNSQIFLISMANPDGVEANTRKNCVPNYGIFGFRKKITSYGVNLNRNFGYKWYLKFLFPFYYFFLAGNDLRDSKANYGGIKPFSENETKAIKNFVETHNISISVSYHTYYPYIAYPWAYSNLPTKDEDLFFSIGENISKINKYPNFGKRNWPVYWRLIGGCTGASEDWLYGEHNILAFLIELGKEHAPKDPETVINMCRNHTGVHLYLCERALLLD
ncbi:MAG: hypothetical protein KAW45_07190 [Thermoplasmatales archaeon]|nr:hypothetical protein [Thermoplasmatales archaeon]